MTFRVGRKPLKMEHIGRLCGSKHAKLRLRMFMATLQGITTVPEACAELDLGEAQFHVARRHWLQAAVEALEPRGPSGRPPKPVNVAALRSERDRLAAEVASLQEQLQAAELRAEIAQILQTAEDVPLKKSDQEPSPSRPIPPTQPR